MKAIVFDRYGDSSVLKYDYRRRLNPEPNEVQVKLHNAALNPVDIEQRQGRFKMVMLGKLPFTPGADFSGTITRVGRRVQGFEVGQEVFGMVPLLQQQGSYAQYMTVRAPNIAQKPEGMTWAEAAGLPLAGLTALQALRDLAHLQAGQRVFVNGGSGGVGHLAIPIAKAMGAVVHTSCSADAADWLRELGADEVIDYHETDITQSKQYFDMFFDVAGRLSYNTTKHILTTKGTYISTMPSVKSGVELVQTLFSRQSAKFILVKPSGSDLRQLLDWWRDDQLKIRIDRSFPLPDAAQAQDYLRKSHPRGKVVLDIPHMG